MSAAQEEWTDRFDNNTSTAAELEAATDELIAAVQELLSTEERRAAAARQRTQRPPASAPTRQHTQQSNTEERTRIQRLWRTNRKRAFREVTGDSSPGCTIDKADVESHFKQIHAASGSLNPTPIPDPLPHPTNPNPLQPLFTADEVWERLRRSSDTAPGPDALRYSHWRRFDPHSHILAAAFNAVHRLSHAPSNWKTSTTVLLHKKGDKADIGNWRPISLASTMGKLYSACLARRLLAWSSAHQRLSPAQKGFISVPGCTEHNFTLQTVIADARRHRRNIAVAWLDLANAFGSLPHSALFDALEWTGLDQTAIGRIRELYTGTTTSVRTATGTTAPIPVEAGVLQGSPLSPILFNLAIEPMLRAAQKSSAGYSLYGHSVSVLAYADDVALIASDATDLQNALNDVSAAADRAGLRFKPAKCASLHFTKGKPKLTTFHVQGGRMPALEKFDAYTHLGVPTGLHLHKSAEDAIARMTAQLKQVDQSGLAEWQKADAVRTFLIPQLVFHLTNATVPKKPLVAFDKELCRCAKRWLHLPQRASTEPLYIPTSHGGLGLVKLQHLADACEVAHVNTLLASQDPVVHSIASQSSQEVAEKKVQRAVTDDEMRDYYNGSTEGVFDTNSTDVASVWTRARMATRRLRNLTNVSWACTNGQLSLRIDDQTAAAAPGTTQHLLRRALWIHELQSLLEKPDQGRVFDASMLHSASNHFMAHGDFTRFCDWRFIHRARLNVLPLNGCRRHGDGDRRCRRCGYDSETAAHVLGRCNAHSRAVTLRHNAIVSRLLKAAHPSPGSVVYSDQKIPGTPGLLRPDIAIIDDAAKSCTVIDVVVTYENRKDAMVAARMDKIRKYDVLKQHFEALGYRTTVDAYVVGTLGSMDPLNRRAIAALNVNPVYNRLMQRLVVSDVIKWARDIYTEHVSGVRQYHV